MASPGALPTLNLPLVPQRTTTSDADGGADAVASDTRIVDLGDNRFRKQIVESAPLPNKGAELEAVAQVLADLEQDDEYRALASALLGTVRDAQAEEAAASPVAPAEAPARELRTFAAVFEEGDTQDQRRPMWFVARAWTSDDECKVTVIEPVYGDGDGDVGVRVTSYTDAPDVDASPERAQQRPHSTFGLSKGVQTSGDATQQLLRNVELVFAVDATNYGEGILCRRLLWMSGSELANKEQRDRRELLQNGRWRLGPETPWRFVEFAVRNGIPCGEATFARGRDVVYDNIVGVDGRGVAWEFGEGRRAPVSKCGCA